MDFYTHPASPNCRKVDAVADQLGIALETKHVDLFAGRIGNRNILRSTQRQGSSARRRRRQAVGEHRDRLLHRQQDRQRPLAEEQSSVRHHAVPSRGDWRISASNPFRTSERGYLPSTNWRASARARRPQCSLRAL